MKSDNINNSLLLISVKPEFAKSIFNGEKTVELRKSAPKNAPKGSYLLIYVTSPVKELWGICKIKNIINDNPKMLWEQIGTKSGISKKQFQDYYRETNNAYGIEIKDVRNFKEKSISLESLKDFLPGFTPPQTYRYIDKSKIKKSQLSRIIS